jgi:phage-related protein
VKQGAKAFVKGLKTFFSGLASWFKNLFSSLGHVFMGFLKILTIKGAKAGIAEMRQGFRSIGKAVNEAMKTAADAVKKTGKAVASGAVSLAKKTKDAFSGLMDSLKGKHKETEGAIQTEARKTEKEQTSAIRAVGKVSERTMAARLKRALETLKQEAQIQNMSVEQQLLALGRLRTEYEAHPDLVRQVDEEIAKLQRKLADEVLQQVERLKKDRVAATQTWLQSERESISELEAVYGEFSPQAITAYEELYTKAAALSADFYGGEKQKQEELQKLAEEINRRKAQAVKQYVDDSLNEIRSLADEEGSSLDEVSGQYKELFDEIAQMRAEDVGGAENKIKELERIHDDYISFLEKRYEDASKAFEEHNNKLRDIASDLNDELQKLTLDEFEYKRKKLEEWRQKQEEQIAASLKAAEKARDEMIAAATQRFDAEIEKEEALYQERKRYLEKNLADLQAQAENIDALVQEELSSRVDAVNLEYEERKAKLLATETDSKALTEALKALEEERLTKVNEVLASEEGVRAEVRERLRQEESALKDQLVALENTRKEQVEEIRAKESETLAEIQQQHRTQYEEAEKAKQAITQIVEAKRTEIVQAEEEKQAEERRKQFQAWRDELQRMIEEEEKRGGDTLQLTRDYWAQRLAEVQAGTEEERAIKNQLFDAEVDLNNRIFEKVNELKEKDRAAALEMLQTRLDCLKQQYPEWTALHNTIAQQIEALQVKQKTVADQILEGFRGVTNEITASFDHMGENVEATFKGVLLGSVSLKEGTVQIFTAWKEEVTGIFKSAKERAIDSLAGVAAKKVRGAFDSIKNWVLGLATQGLAPLASTMTAVVIPAFAGFLTAAAPFLPFILGAGAAVGALYLAWKKFPGLFSKIKDAIVWVWEKLKALGEAIFDNKVLVGVLAVAFAPLTAAIIAAKLAFEGIKLAVGLVLDALRALKDLLVDVFIDLWEDIKSALRRSWDWIRDKFDFFRKQISTVAEVTGRWLEKPFKILKTVLDPVLDVFEKIWEIFKSVGGAVEKILGAIGGGVKKILGMQRGGIVLGPTLAMLGEAGPEMVVPLPPPRLPAASAAMVQEARAMRERFEIWKAELKQLVEAERETSREILQLMKAFWIRRLLLVRAGIKAETAIRSQLLNAEIDITDRLLAETERRSEKEKEAALEELRTHLNALRREGSGRAAFHDAIARMIENLRDKLEHLAYRILEVFRGITEEIFVSFAHLSEGIEAVFKRISSCLIDLKEETAQAFSAWRGMIRIWEPFLAFLFNAVKQITLIWRRARALGEEILESGARIETLATVWVPFISAISRARPVFERIILLIAKIREATDRVWERAKAFGKIIRENRASVEGLSRAISSLVTAIIRAEPAFEVIERLFLRIRDRLSLAWERLKVLGEEILENKVLVRALAEVFAPLASTIIGTERAFSTIGILFERIKDAVSQVMRSLRSGRG